MVSGKSSKLEEVFAEQHEEAAREAAALLREFLCMAERCSGETSGKIKEKQQNITSLDHIFDFKSCFEEKKKNFDIYLLQA